MTLLTPPPLSVLFEKPQIHNPKLSSSNSIKSPDGGSKYIIWLERDEKSKVLNFHCSLTRSVITGKFSTSANDHYHNRNNRQQLSFFTDYDACVHYEVSSDERFLIFLREPILGKEMYHLYTIDLQQAISAKKSWNSSNWVYKDRIPDPKQTCCMGFVGIVQLWISHQNPRVIRFATGYGSLFWDLSELNLYTNKITLIEKHPLSNYPSNVTSTKIDQLRNFYYIWKARIQIGLRTLANIVTSYISIVVSFLQSSILFLSTNYYNYGQSFISSLLVVSPAYIPVEWHLDPKTLEVRGRFEVSVQLPCSKMKSKNAHANKGQIRHTTISRIFQKMILPELHGSWSCTIPSSSANTWVCLHSVPISDLNMHLIGSGPGTGNNRMEFFDYNDDPEFDQNCRNKENNYQVNVHICTHDSEFTSYVQFDLQDSRILKKNTLASSFDSDITGFLFNPIKCQVDAVTFEHERLKIHSLKDNSDTKSEDDYERLQDAFYRLFKKEGSHNACKDCGKMENSDITNDLCNKGIMSFTFYPVSRTRDNRYWLVYAFSDHGCHIFNQCPEAYFIYDNYSKDIKTQQHLISSSPLNIWKIPRLALSAYQLGQCFSFHVKTRNASDTYEKMLCYLSLPFFVKSKSIPLVVFPHGGPNARDYWRYDPVIQLLCTRGVAVLQVQFHGSTGFGMNFLRKGMYGGMFNTIQEDIVDAVHHLLDGGILIRKIKESDQVFVINNSGVENCLPFTHVDSKYDDCDIVTVDETRIGILGGSFGGFCSLFGLTMLENTKARFRYCCGVAFVALYKVGADADDSFRGDLLIKSYWRRVYGTEVSNDKNVAKKVSPFYHANKVEVPLLILHGKSDPRCPVKAAHEFAAQVAKQPSGSVRYIEYEGEGHGLRKESNIMHQWREIEKFFKQNLLGEDYSAQISNGITEGNTSTIILSTI